MAREEEEREDLLREATALVERIELWMPSRESGDPESIVAGFRTGGSASFYFGSDPVYHFNSLSQLRRAFVAGNLIKAQRGNLVAMHRVRTAGEVQLQSRPMSPEEERELCRKLLQRCHRLQVALESAAIEIVGQVPADGHVAERVHDFLTALDEVTIAASPHAR